MLLRVSFSVIQTSTMCVCFKCAWVHSADKCHLLYQRRNLTFSQHTLHTIHTAHSKMSSAIDSIQCVNRYNNNNNNKLISKSFADQGILFCWSEQSQKYCKIERERREKKIIENLSKPAFKMIPCGKASNARRHIHTSAVQWKRTISVMMEIKFIHWFMFVRCFWRNWKKIVWKPSIYYATLNIQRD